MARSALYVEDTTAVMPGAYQKSRDDVQTYMAAAFASPLKGSKAFDESGNVQFLGADTAVVISEGSIGRFAVRRL